MPKSSSLSYFSLVAMLVLAVLGSHSVQAAGRSDQHQPMQIESDALRYEDGSQRSVFTGNVRLNKGSIVMRGGVLEVRQDAAGNQLGTLTGSVQAPAYFRQKRASGDDEYVEAQAQTITYSSATGVVTLTGNARLTRLQGDRPMDTVTGKVIVYNGNSDVFSVNGAVGSAESGAAGGSGRVRVTLTSRNAAAPEPDQVNPDQALKPSLQLKSGSQP